MWCRGRWRRLWSGVQPGAVVCASLSDCPVAGWLVVEESAPGSSERQCAVVRLEGCAVVASGLLSEVKVAGDPVPTESEMPSSGAAGAFWARRARPRRRRHTRR